MKKLLIKIKAWVFTDPSLSLGTVVKNGGHEDLFLAFIPIAFCLDAYWERVAERPFFYFVIYMIYL